MVEITKIIQISLLYLFLFPHAFASAELNLEDYDKKTLDRLPEVKSNIDQVRWLIRANKPKEAVLISRNLLKRYPNIATVRFIAAKSHMADQDREEALKLLGSGWHRLVSRNLLSNPLLEKDYINQVEVLGSLFFTEQGFKIYQSGLKNVESRKWKNAIEDFEKALSIEKYNIGIMKSLSQVFIFVGKISEARTILNKIVSSLPWDIESAMVLAQLELDTGNYKDAAQTTEGILKAKPNDPKVKLIYSRSLFELGQTKEAIFSLKDSVQQNPEHLDSLFFLGKFYFDSDASDWMARKYLSLYLKRSKRLKTEQPSGDTGFRIEAEELLRQVDKRLQL